MKKITNNDMHEIMLWTCPYVKCGYENQEIEPSIEHGEVLRCNKCKKHSKIDLESL